MHGLLEQFVAELPERAQAIRRALEQSDFETLLRLAHQLKGSAGGYGFPTITDAARQLEEAARTTRELSAIDREVKQMIDLCRRATAEAPESNEDRPMRSNR